MSPDDRNGDTCRKSCTRCAFISRSPRWSHRLSTHNDRSPRQTRIVTSRCAFYRKYDVSLDICAEHLALTRHSANFACITARDALESRHRSMPTSQPKVLINSGRRRCSRWFMKSACKPQDRRHMACVLSSRAAIGCVYTFSLAIENMSDAGPMQYANIMAHIQHPVHERRTSYHGREPRL